MRKARSSLDLLATIALALVGLLAALIPLDAWLRVLLLSPLVLVASGYAILAALLPDRELPGGERVVYSVGLSIAATALGGIVVQLAVELERTVWAVLLAVLTVAAALFALRRRARDGAEPQAAAGRTGPHLALPGVLSTLAVTGAVAIAIAAVAISSAGAKRERDAYEFTALWAQAVEPASGTGEAVAIGVDNHQGAPSRYRLVARQGGTTIAKRKLALPDAGRFRLRLQVASISPADPVAVSLHRDGAVYRRVFLESAAAP
jgi:uncharacterized membrane protein